MEIWTLWLVLLLLLAAKAFCQDRTTLLRIDCGAENPDDETWQTDKNFIGTGTNMEIPYSSTSLQVTQLNTLRVFKQLIKNCYTLPTPIKATYFIRAAFYYGNYDKLSDPPTFDIEFDGNKWDTVETAMPPFFQYNEVVYTTQRSSVSVCLARTKEGQFPFISTLEIWPLADNMYSLMDRDVAWFNNYRYNYGLDPDTSNWILGYPDDIYNRIWESSIPEGTVQQYNEFISELNYTTADYPPDSAILYMVEALDSSSSIKLTFQLSQSQTPIRNFISIYFTEPELLDVTQKRLMDIYVNNDLVYNMEPEWGNCSELFVNTKSYDNLNILLSPNTNSTEAAVVSAIEVYTASDPLVTTWTSQDDCDGWTRSLESLIKAFDEQLNNWTWSGDPCLPNETMWEWLGCVSNDPPRVTKIDLEGYGLQGSLPDFSKLEALQTINLADNSLAGAIPNFLGTLPNLKQLDLSNNNFSGKVPTSISGNKNLICNLNGNPYIDHFTAANKKKKNNMGLIIGLSVGLPVALLLIVMVVYFLLKGKQRPKQDQAAATGTPQAGTKLQPDQSSSNISMTAQQMVPLPPTGPFNEEDLHEMYELQNNTGTPQTGTKPQPDQSSSNVSVTAQQTAPLPPTGPFNEEDLHEMYELQNNMGTRRSS